MSGVAGQPPLALADSGGTGLGRGGAEERWSTLDLMFALLAALLASLVPLLSLPFENVPFNDDWSYARMAFSVAKTGTYSFDGWGSPIVGPQAYWGALFAIAFGPTHLALRASVLVLAGLAAALVYAISRLAGLARPQALLAAAACMLSPLAIPLSASFMTDVPCLALELGAVALSAVTIRSKGSPARATACFVAMLLVAFAAGLVRQLAWVQIIAIAPLMILMHRGTPRQLAAWTVAWLASLAGIAVTLAHVNALPYTVPDSIGDLARGVMHHPRDAVRNCIRLSHSSLLLLSPLLPAAWPLLRRIPRWSWASASGLVAAAFAIAMFRGGPSFLFSPWEGNMVTALGITDALQLPGEGPLLVPRCVTIPIAALSWALLLSAALALLAVPRRAGRSAVAAMPDLARSPIFPFVALVAITTLVAGCRSVAFDRYLLPALALAPILMFVGLRRRALARPPRLTWVAVALGGAVGLAFTFTYHQCSRARSAALDHLLAAGIGRSEISAGLELDGECQLRVAGHVNDERIVSPAGAYVPLVENPLRQGKNYWFWKFTPVIAPRYILSFSPMPGYVSAAFEPVTYPSAFPPFRQKVYVLVPEDPAVPALVPSAAGPK